MDWLKTIGMVAPTIATALGGPLAGMATKAIAGALLGDENASQADIEMAVAGATPDDLIKLKQLDSEFELKMAEIGVDLKKVAADDRASARQREVDTKDNAPKILATVIVVGFFVTLGCIAFADIPDKAMQPVNILLGALTAMLTQVGNYYFGSSAGSARKTALLGKQL